jgi:hypothetical protein
VILEQSWTCRTAARVMLTLGIAVQTSRTSASVRQAARALRQLSGPARLRCAITCTAAAATAYVAMERALPAESRAIEGFAVVVLIMLCATAFALPFRE